MVNNSDILVNPGHHRACLSKIGFHHVGGVIQLFPIWEVLEQSGIIRVEFSIYGLDIMPLLDRVPHAIAQEVLHLKHLF